MELALNLSWLALTCLLFTGVLVAERSGKLRLSLKLALGCTAVLALLLFPVISMTDDLQQANLVMEWPSGHSSAGLAGDNENAPLSLAETSFLTLLLLLLAMTAMLTLLVYLLEDKFKARLSFSLEPYAVRPPPILLTA